MPSPFRAWVTALNTVLSSFIRFPERSGSPLFFTTEQNSAVAIHVVTPSVSADGRVGLGPWPCYWEEISDSTDVYVPLWCSMESFGARPGATQRRIAGWLYALPLEKPPG